MGTVTVEWSLQRNHNEYCVDSDSEHRQDRERCRDDDRTRCRYQRATTQSGEHRAEFDERQPHSTRSVECRLCDGVALVQAEFRPWTVRVTSTSIALSARN